MPITPELLDELLKDYKSPTICLVTTACCNNSPRRWSSVLLIAEMTHHLGYEKHDPAGQHTGNSRNGNVSQYDSRHHHHE